MHRFLPFLLFTLTLLHFQTTAQSTPVKVYGWCSWDQERVSEDSLRATFKDWKSHGITGICMNCGFDTEKTARCAAIAHEVGLEYHAWAPTMLQGGMDSTWYTVNRWGQSAFVPQYRAYVDYYQTIRF